MAALVLVVGIVAAVLLLVPRDGVDLAGFSRESTATVSFAGSFPAEDQSALLNPLGIAVRANTLYVAESDAGRVRLFGLRGEDMGSIAVPPRDGALSAYPSDVATLGADKIVVVDNAGERVVVLDADPGAESPAVIVLGAADLATAPQQPSAVAVEGEIIFVADGADLSIKAYSADGRYLRTVVAGAGEQGAFSGGLLVAGGVLYATDSNAGRVAVFDASTGASKGTFPEPFALPRGLGAGLGGGVLVVDTFERVVRLTDKSGRRLDVIEGEANGGPALGSPRDVTWAPSTARIYITDAESGRVVIFNMRAPQ